MHGDVRPPIPPVARAARSALYEMRTPTPCVGSCTFHGCGYLRRKQQDSRKVMLQP
jgi:hypothetical protein